MAGTGVRVRGAGSGRGRRVGGVTRLGCGGGRVPAARGSNLQRDIASRSEDERRGAGRWAQRLSARGRVRC